MTNLTLIIPPALEFTAERVLRSQGLAGSADNDINPYRTRRTWRIVVNPHLSAALGGDDDAWFIAASDKDAHGLCAYKRVPITMEPRQIDGRTGNLMFPIRMRYSFGARWWQGTFATSGG